MTIQGAIGKGNAIANYIMQLQWEDESAGSSRKKRKLDPTSVNKSQVQFPVTLTTVDESTILELINILGSCDEQKLFVQWDFSKIDTIINASMKIMSEYNGECIVENDCCVMSDHFNLQTTKSLTSNAQLFVAMAFGAHSSWLTVSNVKLCASANKRSFNLKFDFDLDLKKAKFDNVEIIAKAILQRIPVKEAPIENEQTQRITSNKNAYFRLMTPPTSTPTTPSLSTVASPSRNISAPLQTNFSTPPAPADTSLASFYENLQPDISENYLENYVSPDLAVKLRPFQTQNVEWMVQREGHIAYGNGHIAPDHNIFSTTPLLFSNRNSKGACANLLTGEVLTKTSEIDQLIKRSLSGGILADEMGLGKTVSVLGLISKHKYEKTDYLHPQSCHYGDKTFSKGTLIVAPGSIMSQWASEAKKHAPHLSVYEYNGAAKDRISAQKLAKYDIVLVYYETFKSELYHSKPPPDRPRRKAVKYKFELSPLVSIFWFRCILDEAQMVESTTTKVASMANHISRWYSWAVTGTPMRSDYNDLYGLYTFLQLENTISKKPSAFEELHSNPKHKGLFFQFTKATVRRNVKSSLTSQISIPKQSRHVVRIPFSSIEQHYYDDFWGRCRLNLRLDWMDSIGWELPSNASGSVQAHYSDSRSKMRSYLLALRQNCIHPSVITNSEYRSGYNPSNPSTGGSNKIRSLDEVLHDMAKNAKDTYDSDQHTYFTLKLRHGGMFELLQDWQKAVDVYTQNIPKVEDLVDFHIREVKSTLNQDEKTIKEEAEEDEERKSSVSHKTNNLFKWRTLLNRYYFYLAGVYHALNSEDLEILYYDKSAGVRRALLEKHLAKVEFSLQELQKGAARISLKDVYNVGPRTIELDLLKFKEYADEDSEDEELEASDRRERAGDMNMIQNLRKVGAILDKQYEKIIYLRSKTMEILTKSLVDNDNSQEDATGDEYENSLSEQEMCQVYISAYQALLQDRKYIIRGTVVPIADMIGHSDNNEVVSDKAKQVQQVEMNFRRQLRSPGFHIESFKDIEFFLRTLRGTMREQESEPEFEALMSNLEWLRTKFSVQSKLIEDLDTDFKKLNQLFNSRIAYYKHLQQISDTLIDWEDNDPHAKIRLLEAQEAKMEQSIIKSKSKDAYFKALVEEHANMDHSAEETRKECLICREPIEKGMVTYCGHTSCVDCGHLWFNKSRRCHTCNATVNPNEWYNVSYKEMEMLDKDSGNHNGGSSGALSNNGEEERSQGHLKLLIDKINTQSIEKGQGAKLDSIIRHIKYIKTSSNDKCVVFSQWTRVLDLLKIGLDKNGIQSISLSGGVNKTSVAKFQEDPNINVILLHARSQSSGLTLVSAQTVFIIEPVLNESLEKQAINRIHRIGQKKETSVFWYLIRDSIEERIYEIHNRKRKEKLLTNTAEIDDKLALSKLSDGGGEFVSDDDLRRCFTANENFLD